MTNVIVLCGSMRHYELMKEISETLNQYGVDVRIPAAYEQARELPYKEYIEIKRKVSISHFGLIANPNTFAILVVNPIQHSVVSYIGPNTFADIAIAAWYERKIYLYYGIPSVLRDELEAWQAIPLDEDLSIIYKDISGK